MTKSTLFVPIAFSLIVGAGVAGLGYLGYLYPPYVTVEASSEAVEQETTLDNLLDAIEWVESRGDANAVGDGEAAIGAYQIHKIYVDDVNRILTIWKVRLNEIFTNYHKQYPDPNNIKSVDFEPYTYEDRWNKIHSRFMTEVYLTYYTPLDDKLNIDLEAAARIHNGGPNGWKKESTKKYWEKVKARLGL